MINGWGGGAAGAVGSADLLWSAAQLDLVVVAYRSPFCEKYILT